MRGALVVLATMLAVASVSDEPRFDFLCSADGDGVAGGGTAPPATPSAPAAAAAPPPPQAPATPPAKSKAEADADAREARLAAVKDLGFDSIEAFEADKVARKKEADAKLSDNERTKKALDETLDARTKAEARAEKLKLENDALREQAATRDTLDAQGVAPKERRVTEVLLADAKAAAKAEGKAFDEKKFFEDQRKERPYLFGAAAPAGAQASASNAAPGVRVPPPATPFSGGGDALPNALTMSDEQYRKERYGRSLRRRLI